MTGRLNNDHNPRRAGGTRPLGTAPLRATPPPPPPPPRPDPARPNPQARRPGDADQVARRGTAELPEVELEGIQAPSREERAASPSAERRPSGFDLSNMIGSLTGQAQAANSQRRATEGSMVSGAMDSVGDFFGGALTAIGFEDAGRAVNGAIDTAGVIAEGATNVVGMVENAVVGVALGTAEIAVDVVEDTAGVIAEGTSRAVGVVGDMAEAAQRSAANGGDLGDMLSAAGETGAREAREQLIDPAAAAIGEAYNTAAGAVVATGQVIGQVAESVGDIAEGGMAAANREAAAGGSALDVAGAFFDGAGSAAYDEIVVPAMDAIAGPVVMNEAGTGPRFASDVGDLAPLTQRINTGQTVALFGDVGVTVPTPVPALGVTLDAGAQISLERVDMGNGRTEIRLQIEGHGAAGVEAGLEGARFRGTGGDTQFGANAGMTANGSAAVTGAVSATFAFDPTNPQDMADLAGMMRGFGGAAAGQAVLPGPAGAMLGGLIAGGEQTREAMGRARGRLIEIDGNLGMQVSATLNLGLSVGGQRREAGEGEDPVRELNPLQNAALDRTNTALADLTAGFSGAFRVGQQRAFREGEVTTYLEVEGNAELSANLLGRTTGGSVEGNLRLAVITDAQGQQRIEVQRELTREELNGYRTTIESASGRPIRDGMLATVRESDTIQVTARLDDAVARRILNGDTAALRQAFDLSSGAYRIEEGGIVAIHTERRAIGGSMGVGSADVRATVGFERRQQTVL